MASIESLKKTFCFGMHGCGAIHSICHTNSQDALAYWRTKGINVMEVDVAKTDDNEYVALAHAMNEKYLRRLDIEYPEGRGNLQWFLNLKLCSSRTSGLTPLSITDIISMMDYDDNLIVMFDTYGMFTADQILHFGIYLKEKIERTNAELYNRITVEAYNLNMVDGIRKADSRIEIIYCVYDNLSVEYHDRINSKILASFGINVISFPWKYAVQNLRMLKDFKKAGLIIFSVTKDNRYSLIMKLLGINVNLVDYKYSYRQLASKAIKKFLFS